MSDTEEPFDHHVPEEVNEPHHHHDGVADMNMNEVDHNNHHVHHADATEPEPVPIHHQHLAVGHHDVLDKEEEDDNDDSPRLKRKSSEVNRTEEEERERAELMKELNDEPLDEKALAYFELIKVSQPTTELEMALSDTLHRKDQQILRMSNEIKKLKAFISKRKQTYKRKRKEEGAPTRALSAYNIFIQDRFKQLAKENEKALNSTDSDAQLKRVPPASLVASTGNQWKDLPVEEKAKYEERAKGDRKRYEEQMSQYNPPDRASNRKRNKTGCKFLAMLGEMFVVS